MEYSVCEVEQKCLFMLLVADPNDGLHIMNSVHTYVTLVSNT